MENKFWLKILVPILIILVVLFSAAYLFLALQGKSIFEKELERALQKPVSIGYLRLSPSLNIEVRNLNIQGLAQVDSIYVSPSILNLLMGRIAFNEIRIIRPRLTYEKPATGAPKKEMATMPVVSQPQKPSLASAISAISNITSAPSDIAAVTEGVATAINAFTPAKVANITTAPTAAPEPLKSQPALPPAPQQKQYPPLIFKHIIVKDGQLDFIDRQAGSEGIKITLKDIFFNLTNLYLLPRSVATNFELRARIPWQEGSEEGKIEASGWLNLYKKDIQATLKISDIDGIYLYPYYSQWVDLEKARIAQAKLNFSSKIQGVNNDITAACHLELTDIVRTPRSGDEPQEKAEKIADAVLDVFRALNNGKIVLDFTIRTKMDRPEFGFDSIREAFENKLAQGRAAGAFRPEEILKAPGKVIEGTVKSARDLSKAVLDGVFAIANEIKKTAEDTFRREPKE